MLRLFFLGTLLGISLAKDSYIFIAPKSVRPGMDLEISANILKAPSAVNVKASLLKRREVVATITDVLTSGKPKSLTISVPKNLTSSYYYLKIEGSGGLTFSVQKHLSFKRKSMSVFIQTDKGIYKPGQTVHFRTFAIYPNMKTYTGPLNVEIFDSNSNKMKQWLDVQDPTGVITNYFSLSARPVLGDWKIKVTAGSETSQKTFTIAEYVLPKFEVTVELPSFVLSSDNDLTATVKAKYTYGKPLKGTVDLVAKIQNTYYWGRPPVVPTVLLKATIDGETKITVPFAKFKEAYKYGIYNKKISVTANVTEDLTGNSMSGSSEVDIYRYAEKLEFADTNPETFKPGLNYIAYLMVLLQDGRPVPLGDSKVTVGTRVTAKLEPQKTSETSETSVPTLELRRPYYYYPQTTSYQLPERTFSVPANGIVPINLDIPANATSVSLTVKYAKVSAYKTIKKSYSPSDNYIQLVLGSQSLAAGDDVHFKVRATEAINNYVYQIMSRGSIVATGLKNAGGKTHFKFSIPLSSDMAPNARIILYYVRADGEIVTDSISFDLEGVFENQVSISMDKSSAQPGESVKVKVTADPLSLVSLLAVDQSVLLLSSGNDITQGEVIDEIKSYDTIKNKGIYNPYGGGIRFRRKRLAIPCCWGFPIYYGGSDATKIFQNAGVVVLTDALVYKYVEPYVYYSRARMAFGARKSSSGSLQEVERVRTEFPETWLWTNTTIYSCADGSATISTVVPDTITSWVATAFAVNRFSGLGVAPSAAKITVFRSFFVSLNLPYSVIRGEQLVLQAIVFNYLTKDVNALVTLAKSSEYLNVIINSNGTERTDNKEDSRIVHVKAGEAKSVFFPIVPDKLGHIDIQVSARTPLAADAVKRQLLVEAEGCPREYNVPVLIDLKKSTSFSKKVSLTLPKNVVPGSAHARITAIGDLMGPSVNNLDKLLRMPTGCGEQTMLSLAPDVFITNYLKATNQLTGEIADKALRFMEKGYQNELRYQHRDGAFSAFGNRDRSGSMWLTAFVVKTFHQAKPHIFVDDKVIERAVQWMIGRQEASGAFPEPGRVIHKSMTGGAGSGTALTAYVVIALLETDDLSANLQPRVNSAVAKAVKFLESQTPADDYILAITTYALTLANSNHADSLLATLESHAIIENGYKYWHRPITKPTTTHSYWRPPINTKAIDVEMTSYALLIYGERKDFIGGLNIMKWIAAQRNPQGGFCSTQDTVVALQALSESAKIVYSKNVNVQIKVTAGGATETFSINSQNSLVLQSKHLTSVTDTVLVEATGSGIALVEIGVFFNVNADEEEPSFHVTTEIVEEDMNSLSLKVCASWLEAGTSGMAIEEIGIPTGFEVDMESITQLDILKRTELENKKLILYFDEIGTKEVCIDLNMRRTGMVVKIKPVPVRCYDYYEPDNQVITFYTCGVLSNASICNVCADCEGCPAVKR